MKQLTANAVQLAAALLALIALLQPSRHKANTLILREAFRSGISSELREVHKAGRIRQKRPTIKLNAKVKGIRLRCGYLKI